MVSNTYKEQREYERLVALKQSDRKVQAAEMKEQMDYLVKAIKDNDMAAYMNLVGRDPMLPHYLYNNMYHPIHVACEFGRLQMVKHLVEEIKVNLDARCNITGYTPLMYAAQTA